MSCTFLPAALVWATKYKLNGATGITNTTSAEKYRLLQTPPATQGNILLDLNALQKLGVSLIDALGHIVWQQSVSEYPSGSSSIASPTQLLVAGSYYYRVSDRAV
jgi:hypothetical protein